MGSGLGERHHEALSLSWHHELYELLPEGLGPCQGHRTFEGPGSRNIHRWLEKCHGSGDCQEQRARVWDDVQLSRAGSRALLLNCRRARSALEWFRKAIRTNIFRGMWSLTAPFSCI